MKIIHLAALTALSVGVIAAISTPADAAPAAGAHSQKRVCSVASAGHAACDAHVATDSKLRPLATTSYQSGFSPAQLKTAYALSGSSTATVAIVDAYASPNAASDLAKYRTQFGLGTAALTQVNQTGGTSLPPGNTGWGQEEMLDLEMVSAICPSCHILYVGAASASFADLGTAVNTAVAKGAKVVSNSYGGSETSNEVSAYGAYYNHPGVAITVSSGDSGYGPQTPAAFSTVTAVGGTSLTLNSNNTRKNETVWSGAGSGCSAYVAKPSWQHDTACAKRTITDVAAVADPNTGVAVYDSYGSTGGANWYVFGGTSVAAPLIGAVYALSGNTTGVPAALSYSNTSALNDVTSGSNGRCTSRKTTSAAYLCTGAAGYDGPTGNGTPIGTAAF